MRCRAEAEQVVATASSMAEAAKWYRAAAEQGLAEAQYCLGLLYEYGMGVEQSSAEAAKWYRKAAEQGLELAEDRLKSVESK